MKNFKSMSRQAFLISNISIFVGLGVMVLLFQNCSEQRSFEFSSESGFEDSSNSSFSKDTFSTSDTIEKNLRVTVDGGWTTTQIQMTGEMANHAEEFQQVIHPDHIDIYEQGFSGTSTVDTFQQESQSNVIDILIVIDNSGSMSQEQNFLSSRLSPLLSSIQGADWKIGVVTTRESDGCMRSVIQKGEANVEEKFANAILAGAIGSREYGLLQMIRGLNCTTPQWIRAGSPIAILIVSDEDDDSLETPTDVQNALINLGRQPGVDARVYGILLPNRLGEYQPLIENTNGLIGNITSQDYTPILNQISQNIGSILKNQFELSATPNPASLVVRVNSQVWNSPYNVSGRTITFSNPLPPQGANIEVRYETPSRPIFRSVTLSRLAYFDSLQVEVDNRRLQDSEFSYDTSTREVQLVSAPPQRAIVRIRYEERIPMIRSFAVDPNIIPRTMRITNKFGQLEPNITLNTDTNEVQFNFVPKEGETFDVTYDFIRSPQLRYTLPARPNDEVFAKDNLTQENINIQTSSGQVVFNRNEFQYGRVVELRYRSSDQGEQFFDLPETIDPASINIISGQNQCRISTGPLGVQCDSSDNIDLNVTYLEKVPRRYFQLPLRDGFTDGPGNWKVTLNGENYSNFEIQGSELFLLEDIIDGDLEIEFVPTL